MQLGGVLGTTVFGTIMATKVGDVLFAKLTGAGLSPTIAKQLDGAKEFVAQGVSPVPKGASASVAQAVTTGSHLAFMTGFSTSLVIASIVSLVAAFGALLVRRGENAGSGGGLAL